MQKRKVHFRLLHYKVNRNVQDSTIYIVNYCNKHRIACDKDNHKKEWAFPKHACGRQQGDAQTRNKMRTVTG